MRAFSSRSKAVKRIFCSSIVSANNHSCPDLQPCGLVGKIIQCPGLEIGGECFGDGGCRRVVSDVPRPGGGQPPTRGVGNDGLTQAQVSRCATKYCQRRLIKRHLACPDGRDRENVADPSWDIERQAQSSLLEHNEKINKLLEQIDFVKETEKKQQEILKTNDELSGQIDDLRSRLAQKEKEVSNIRQKEHLTSEMTSLLDSAHNEFNALQGKIQKLESQVITSKTTNLQYEEVKEGYFKVSRDFEEQKLKYNVVASENRQLKANLSETEEKLTESNFQRQQLQKKVAYLEGLNNDMQAVADAQKKLESQLKRIGELESMLNIVAEEKNELANRK